MNTILRVKNLKKYYSVKKSYQEVQQVRALSEASFELEENKTLGIVGESGCGKSTLAKALVGVETPTSGEIIYQNRPIESLGQNERRQAIQMIFQDPYSSLNPRKPAWRLIAEPLLINTNLSQRECYAQALNLMRKVSLRPELAHSYPHMFSGGQRQRIGIARALSLKPKILICDEPVSALDVSIQAQVLNLLIKLQDEMNLSYLFIGHNLNVIHHVSDTIMVMYLGRIVEYGKREEVFGNPQHPYTKVLIASSPTLDKKATSEPVRGELPSPFSPPSGCAFHKRCPIATEKCSLEQPPLEFKKNRSVACFYID